MKLPRLNRDYLPAIGLGVTQIVGHSTLLYAYAVLFQTATLGILSALSTVAGSISQTLGAQRTATSLVN